MTNNFEIFFKLFDFERPRLKVLKIRGKNFVRLITLYKISYRFKLVYFYDFELIETVRFD